MHAADDDDAIRQRPSANPQRLRSGFAGHDEHRRFRGRRDLHFHSELGDTPDPVAVTALVDRLEARLRQAQAAP